MKHEAFINLMKRYESITLEEIQALNCDIEIKANKLTGFGYEKTCTLCQEALSISFNGHKCDYCSWVYLSDNICCYSRSKQGMTYRDIENAETDKELFFAFIDRASYMKELLKANNIEI